ncbi:hypothetical protein XM38_014110 [Halomicronema hongdechloris C2206]|uniref:Trypsin-co-occurring domain-containing protein n=1 Tax=Halomicronema hongdechloris C2206 TaxID=1641165 RepID=A0A1Z3HJI4_9CYAN|nr:CU044_2847 family protein [Halomicronema hongdechloris]ASC70472.1 hypothetical protein XM38_014110 [Halomicronema hongdechloris C2206]
MSAIIHTNSSPEESILLFEVTRSNGQLRPQQLKPQELAVKSAQALDQAMGTIQGVANCTSETLGKLAQSPSEVEIEFAIKVDAEVGALIANGRQEGNLRVKLVWKNDRHLQLENGVDHSVPGPGEPDPA